MSFLFVHFKKQTRCYFFLLYDYNALNSEKGLGKVVEKKFVFMFIDNHNSQLYVSNSSTDHPTNSTLGITNLEKYHKHYFHIVFFLVVVDLS